MKKGWLQKTGKGKITGQGYRTVWMKLENGRLSWSMAPGEKEKNAVHLTSGYKVLNHQPDSEYFSIKNMKDPKKRDVEMRVLKSSDNKWVEDKKDWIFQIQSTLLAVLLETSRQFLSKAKRWDSNQGNHVLAYTMYFNGVETLMEAMKIGKCSPMISSRVAARDAINRMSEMRGLYTDLRKFVPETLESPKDLQRGSLNGSSSSLLLSLSSSKLSDKEKDSKAKSLLIGKIVQTGILRTINKDQVAEEDEGLAEDAFVSKTRVKFKVDGDHEILFKSYANTVFAKLRGFALTSQSNRNFAQVLTEKNLEGGTKGEGKSGQIFFRSHDYRYILKTISEAEHLFLLSFLPDYYTHMNFFPKKSLLCRFLYLMSFSCPEGDCVYLNKSKIRLVVMENCFYTPLSIHRKFDLKGSTVKRSVDLMTIESLSSVTLKDLNFTEFDLVALQGYQRDDLMKQLRQDTALLQAHNIMDYSLLLGVHHGTNQSSDRRRNVYFVYIVDILQYYNIAKVAETAFKGTILGQGELMSCIHPNKYKERFDKFMEKVVIKSDLNFGTLILPNKRCLWNCRDDDGDFDDVSKEEEENEIDFDRI